MMTADGWPWRMEAVRKMNLIRLISNTVMLSELYCNYNFSSFMRLKFEIGAHFNDDIIRYVLGKRGTLLRGNVGTN